MQSVTLGLMARLSVLCLVLSALSSCGGGGGGSDSGGYSSGGGGSYGTPNNAPRWSADSEAVEMAENLKKSSRRTSPRGGVAGGREQD